MASNSRRFHHFSTVSRSVNLLMNIPAQRLSSPLLSKTIPDSPVLMTIPLGPLIRRSAVRGRGPAFNVLPLLRAAHPDRPLTSSPAKSTNLLQRFIKDFKEIESYR